MIEALIAIIIIAVAATGIAATFSGSAQRQTDAKAHTRQLQIAKSALERVQTDRVWSRAPNCTGPTCSVAICPSASLCSLVVHMGNDQLTDPSMKNTSGTPLRYALEVRARGVAAPRASGPAAMTPDYFTITVRVSAINPPKPIRPAVLTGTVDPTGRVDLGTFSIAVCGVTPQIDERVALSMQANPGTGCRNQSFPIAKNIACAEARAIDCAALSSAAMPAAYKTSQITPYGGAVGPFRLRDNSGNVYGPYTVSGGYLDSRNLSPALGRLRPGYYRIESYSTLGDPLPPAGNGPRLATPPGYELWQSHSVPNGSFISVEAGRHTSTVQLLQPTTTFRVYFRTENVTDPWFTTFAPGPPPGDDVAIKLVSLPLGRTDLRQAGNADQWFKVTGNGGAGAGSYYLDMENMPTGIYAAQLIRYPGNRVFQFPDVKAHSLAPSGGPSWDSGVTSPFGFGGKWYGYPSPTQPAGWIWLDQNPAANQPAALLVTMRYCNPLQRMQIFRHYCQAYPSYPFWCWAERQIGPVETNMVKKYITPCQDEPTTGWGSIGKGNS